MLCYIKFSEFMYTYLMLPLSLPLSLPPSLLPPSLSLSLSPSLSLILTHSHRDDFKLILREVRRNNSNTLSGLSLDSIAEQVRGIIEARERAKGGGGEDPETKAKPRAPLPPVAQAPPPIQTTMEYTDEWSCVICYEDMDGTDSRRLMCGHRFHTEVRT